jgi:NADPH-dependent glutamate synthase beta chain and related oxidoreductases
MALRRDYDAVVLAIGQAGVKALGIAREERVHVLDAVDFIAALRQSGDRSRLAVGRRVVVIGGGNTAIDAATQAKRLGAEVVTIVYRRGRGEMSATPAEQEWALTNGVALRLWAMPVGIEGGDGVRAVRFARTSLDAAGRLVIGAEEFSIEADMVLKAVGQTVQEDEPDLLPAIAGGRIVVDGISRETSMPGVFAAGDCIAGVDLTVQAVEDGKRAAAGIEAWFGGAGSGHG